MAQGGSFTYNTRGQFHVWHRVAVLRITQVAVLRITQAAVLRMTQSDSFTYKRGWQFYV